LPEDDDDDDDDVGANLRGVAVLLSCICLFPGTPKSGLRGFRYVSPELGTRRCQAEKDASVFASSCWIDRRSRRHSTISIREIVVFILGFSTAIARPDSTARVC
jgi:hypothetical protein